MIRKRQLDTTLKTLHYVAFAISHVRKAPQQSAYNCITVSGSIRLRVSACSAAAHVKMQKRTP